MVVQYGDVVGVGYNRVVIGARDMVSCAAVCRRAYRDGAADPAYHDCYAVHAEAAALLEAGRRAAGATLFVTDVPCHACAILVVAAGVGRVVIGQAERDVPDVLRQIAIEWEGAE
jgi:deoxycytidylate deaminase